MSAPEKHRDVRAARNQAPEVGVDALGDLDTLGGRIASAVEQQFFMRELASPGVVAVYVCGSFAAGTARKGFSDLDVRAVYKGDLAVYEREAIETELREDFGPEVTPDAALFLDVNLRREPPGNDTPSVQLYPTAEPNPRGEHA